MRLEPPPLAYAVPDASDDESSRRSARRLIGAGVVAWGLWYAVAMVLQEARWPNLLSPTLPFVDRAVQAGIAAALLATIGGGGLLFRGRKCGARVACGATAAYLLANAALWFRMYLQFPSIFTDDGGGWLSTTSQALLSLGHLLSPVLLILVTAPPVARVLRLR